MIHTSEEKPHEYPHLGEYHPNPKGFYEVVPTKKKTVFESYIDIYNMPYSGCKMIVPVQGIRWDVVKSKPSKVIFMVRDPQEIKDSQEAFYSRESDLAYIRTALVSQRMALKEAGIPYLEVNHRDLMTNTFETVSAVRDFIGSDAPIQPCIDFVDPSLYRHKAHA